MNFLNTGFFKTIAGSVSLAALLCLGACGAHDHDHAEHEGEHTDKEKAEDHDHEGVVVFTAEQAKACGVETAEVRPGEFTGVIRTTGEIVAAPGDERTVSAKAAGIVSFAGGEMTPGAPVGAGQTLFRISARGVTTTDNNAPLRATLASAEARLKRADGLLADKLITQTEYDLIKAEVAAARAALATPQAAVTSGGDVAASPISGYIAECLVRPGDYIEVGAPLAVVTTNRQLQLRADVPQRYSADLSSIRGANIVVPADDERRIRLADYGSRVVSVGKGSNSTASLYVPVTIEFNNPGGLTAGMPVEAYLLTDRMPGVITVPREALTEEEGMYFVYVEQSPEHFRKQRVDVGATDGVSTQITSGLKEGERIVVKGATMLKLAANSGKAPQGHNHNH